MEGGFAESYATISEIPIVVIVPFHVQKSSSPKAKEEKVYGVTYPIVKGTVAGGRGPDVGDSQNDFRTRTYTRCPISKRGGKIFPTVLAAPLFKVAFQLTFSYTFIIERKSE
jgi:hypothetical protein